MMIALYAGIWQILMSTLLFDAGLGPRLINEFRIAPVRRSGECCLARGDFLDAVHKVVIPGLVVDEHHRIMEPVVELRFDTEDGVESVGKRDKHSGEAAYIRDVP